MRLLSALASLIAIASLTFEATAYEDNCKGSGLIVHRRACDAAIQSIDDNTVYEQPQVFSQFECTLDYKCWGHMLGKELGIGVRRGGYPILGFSLRETAMLMKVNCLDRWAANKVVGTYGTGNDPHCTLTMNLRPNYNNDFGPDPRVLPPPKRSAKFRLARDGVLPYNGTFGNGTFGNGTFVAPGK
ncbi:MAG: hypothetical protein Q9209_004631 [Squamulea sp. 1 TL-2023]